MRAKPPEADLADDELALLGMSKDEVYQELRCSATTMAGLLMRGKLTPKTEPDGTQIFDRAQVQEVKQRLLYLRGIRQAVQKNQSIAPAAPAQTAPEARGVVAIPAALIDALRERREPREVLKPWLGVKDAAEYSGLPAAWLIEQARAGLIRAVNVGSGAREYWRFNRAALEQ